MAVGDMGAAFSSELLCWFRCFEQRDFRPLIIFVVSEPEQAGREAFRWKGVRLRSLRPRPMPVGTGVRGAAPGAALGNGTMHAGRGDARSQPSALFPVLSAISTGCSSRCRTAGLSGNDRDGPLVGHLIGHTAGA